MSLRVLFLGENWYGSCARACCYALRRLGCDVCDVDVHTFVPQLRSKGSRLILRALGPLLVREYNDRILERARYFSPDLLLAFKGSLVLPETLRILRKQGIALYNYYPDTSAFAHGNLLPRALPEYDCVFYTKRFWQADTRKSVPLMDSVFLPHGYDPEIHRPFDRTTQDLLQYTHDCVVIATFTQVKQDLLRNLLRLRPSLQLRIWGNQWKDRCSVPQLQQSVMGVALEGDSYAKALAAARINLGILSGRVKGSSQGDETSTRTYEIPACGGFMLHERTPELAELFEEDKEVACFGSVEELAEKIDFYLAHPEERERIAAGGHRRCVPAYSYDERMRCLVAYYAGQAKAWPAVPSGAKPESQSELCIKNSELR